MSNKPKRLGIFGGTFDPVHLGHLLLAETCREACSLDEVWFVPAAIPPHKQDHVLSSGKQRIEMLELALAGHPGLRPCGLEIQRGGISYTVDTLTQIRQLQPEAELFFLMGADSLRDLPSWREPARVCELASPLVVRRSGSADPDYGPLAEFVTAERLRVVQGQLVDMPLIEISSTDLRQRVATGRSIRFRTPRAVEKYIEMNALYVRVPIMEEARSNLEH